MNRNDLNARAAEQGLTVEATTKTPASHVITLTGDRLGDDRDLAALCGYNPAQHFGYRVHRDAHRATVILYTD